MKECDVERRLCYRVRQALGGWALKFVSPGQLGVPDRLVLLPGGRPVFVELKAPGAKPRPAQLAVHARLRRLGFRVEVLDSCQMVDAFVEELHEGGDCLE